jgi:hypothetical protein
MHPLRQSLQSVRDVSQTGVHRYHAKDGAFEDKIALKLQFDDPSEIFTTLELLIASSATWASEKQEFKKMLDFLGMTLRISDIASWYSKEEVKAFETAIDHLRAPFGEDHRKRSLCSLCSIL